MFHKNPLETLETKILQGLKQAYGGNDFPLEAVGQVIAHRTETKEQAWELALSITDLLWSTDEDSSYHNNTVKAIYEAYLTAAS